MLTLICTSAPRPQACLSELRRQLARLEPLRRQQVAGAADDPAAAAEGAEDAEELHAALTTGLQHCLLWLYGLELPGLEKQEAWGGDFQVGGWTGRVGNIV